MTHATPLFRYRLAAHTRRLDSDTDILSALTSADFAWLHHGEGIVTNGVAGRVPVGSVGDVLSTVDTYGDNVPSASPIAVGALPFDPAAAARATMVVPARIWRRDGEGRIWLTHVSGRHGAEWDPHETGQGLPGAVPRGDTSYEEWVEELRTALSSIEAGTLDKVVLARQVTVEAEAAFPIRDVVKRLQAGQLGCYVFAAEGLVGASPELLVERRGVSVRSRPMAGTVVRNDERALNWLEESPKNRREHLHVVDAVVRTLEQLGSARVAASSLRAEPFADVAHIVSDVTATLPPNAPSALELALAIHPTPAIAGTPTEAALALIAALETRSRGRYGGPVGWVDANGDGEFAVALRCAEVRANRAVLYAGAGIVTGSKWDDEWRETEAKLKAMRRALAGR